MKHQLKKRLKSIPLHYHVKRGDMVMVIAGKSKGKIGTVKAVLRKKGKVIVEGANIIKKAVKPDSKSGQAGGLLELEAPINVSKVMLYDVKSSQASRAKVMYLEGNNKIRVSKKSDKPFDD